MGDRANVFIQQSRTDGGIGETWGGVGIYSHWDGTDLHRKALDALTEARLLAGDDVSYLTRYIVGACCPFEKGGFSGYGIWCDALGPDDNGHPILVINAVTGRYWYVSGGQREWRLDEPVAA